MTRSIPVAPPSPLTMRFLIGVAVAFCTFLGYLYLNSPARHDPAQAQAQLIGTLSIMGVALALVALMSWAVNRRSVELTDTTLSIRAGLYTRVLQRSSLRTGSAVVASLFANRSIAPRWRTNGIRVPGFQAGWFRLVNGDKAFVLLTHPDPVTYLPTTEGFSLLISTSELIPALNQPRIEGQ